MIDTWWDDITKHTPLSPAAHTEFTQHFYRVWSDGADELSQFYTGANCIISQVMRNEGYSKRYSDFLMVQKSTTRFIKATIQDECKQRLINMMLRKHSIND